MVNSKNVAFKVNKQSPATGPPPRAYATVINCRKPAGKRALQALRGEKEVKSRKVPLAGVGWTAELEKKRKRSEHENEDETNSLNKKFLEWESSPGAAYALATVEDNSSFSSSQTSQTLKPTRFRRGKTLSKGVDLDCWFTILTFSDPAQLLEMRSKIASCYRFLRDNPMLWKHSRDYYYGSDMPDPPHELTEFQYAHLRHGHGCMSCNTPSTRKTYWAFLRRWCKTCLQSKTIKEHDAMTLFKDANGEDISFIAKCLPSGIFDSWGNFVGVGPASTHSLKTIYLLSDVQKIVAEFIKESRENYISWHAEMRTWISNKVKIVEERREFARKMENWEDSTRTTKSFDYQAKKTARKAYFAEKAAQLHPPISQMMIEGCPSYRRAVAIPKEPNITSWLQLKPKLEKEWPEVAARLERERLERERLERERLERERLERERVERERVERERLERERLERERLERERLERERLERERLERERVERERLERERVERERVERERVERERVERERVERERLERERLERERVERERLERERVERERVERETVERERVERERVERERVEREAAEAAARLEREPTALAAQGVLPSLHPPPPRPPFPSSGNLTPNNGIS